MAKKAKKASKKATKKASKKQAGRTVSSRTKTSASRAPRNPLPITTGRGPGPAEIGGDLVAMFNRGQMAEIEAKWYSPKIVSIEGGDVSMAWSGMKAVQEKSAQWMATHRIHGASAEGPYVGASGFAVKFTMDVEDTAANTRGMLEEVGVYQVEDGKIVREEFMYGKYTPISGASNGTA